MSFHTTTFSALGNGIVFTGFDSNECAGKNIAVQDDGKILVAGINYNYGGDVDFLLARYNTDGSLDSSFSDDGKLILDFNASDDFSESIVVQSDGKILMAGCSYSYSNNNYNDFALVRYNADGSLDSSFSGDGMLTTDFGSNDDYAEQIFLQNDGKILVVGHTINDDNYAFAMARYNSDGSLDSSFSGDGKLVTDSGFACSSVVLQADGKIVIAGYDNPFDPDFDFAVARYNADGSLDSSFGNGGKVITDFDSGSDSITSAIVQNDGKILVAGCNTNTLNASSDFALVRYNTDGSLDSSFSEDGKLTMDFGSNSTRCYDVTVQSDGKILVAGFSSGNFTLARINTDGSLDSSFSDDGMLTLSISYVDSVGLDIAVQNDGKILVSGYTFDGFGSYVMLARYNVDGSLDETFGSGVSNDGPQTFIGDQNPLDLRDTLSGNSGGDVLIGGLEGDLLTGSSGADWFVYQNFADTGIGASNRDIITDFSSEEGDRIVFDKLDADPTLAGLQEWTLVSDGFNGTAGQVTFDNNTHLVQFDLEGDNQVDFEIELTGVSSLMVWDIISI